MARSNTDKGRGAVNHPHDDEDNTVITDLSLISWPTAELENEIYDVLTMVMGPERGRTFILDQSVTRLGRAPICEIRIDDESISRVHAILSNGKDGWTLEDLGSSNGTFVTNQRIERHAMKEGDAFQLGSRVVLRHSRLTSQQAVLIRELYESSVRDPLTGVANRRYLEGRLRADVSFGIRHGTDLAVLLMDIDHFKRVNDTFGHAIGDDILRMVAKAIRSGIRTEDLIARYGGEEFVVLAPGIGVEGAMALGERLRGIVSNLRSPDHDIVVTVSVGVATLASSERSPNPQKILCDADERLYAAKGRGRNCVIGP